MTSRLTSHFMPAAPCPKVRSRTFTKEVGDQVGQGVLHLLVGYVHNVRAEHVLASCSRRGAIPVACSRPLREDPNALVQRSRDVLGNARRSCSQLDEAVFQHEEAGEIAGDWMSSCSTFMP
jgi:hypothetical protein